MFILIVDALGKSNNTNSCSGEEVGKVRGYFVLQLVLVVLDISRANRFSQGRCLISLGCRAISLSDKRKD